MFFASNACRISTTTPSRRGIWFPYGVLILGVQRLGKQHKERRRQKSNLVPASSYKFLSITKWSLDTSNFDTRQSWNLIRTLSIVRENGVRVLLAATNTENQMDWKILSLMRILRKKVLRSQRNSVLGRICYQFAKTALSLFVADAIKDGMANSQCVYLKPTLENSRRTTRHRWHIFSCTQHPAQLATHVHKRLTVVTT